MTKKQDLFFPVSILRILEYLGLFVPPLLSLFIRWNLWELPSWNQAKPKRRIQHQV